MSTLRRIQRNVERLHPSGPVDPYARPCLLCISGAAHNQKMHREYIDEEAKERSRRTKR